MRCPVNWPTPLIRKKTWNTVLAPVRVPVIGHPVVNGHNPSDGSLVAVYVPETVPSELWVTLIVMLVKPAEGPAANHVPEPSLLAGELRSGPHPTVAIAIAAA